MTGSTTPPLIRLFMALLKLFLPAALLFAAAAAVAAYFFAADIATPPARSYLVTPGEYAVLSERGRQVTEETWTNPDGSVSRGWLLRGRSGAPAVIFLHGFGNDRSHVLNLGVRLNEATDYTVLMPDLRAHGIGATERRSSFGGCEADDLTAALAFLKSINDPSGRSLVGAQVGVYGVGIGALATLRAASSGAAISSMLLDSVPTDSEDVMKSLVGRRYPVPTISFELMKLGAKVVYFDGCLRRGSSCELARSVKTERVALFAGNDFPMLEGSTEVLAACFPSQIETKVTNNLPVSGYAIMKASVREAEEYSDKVTAYFKESLGNSK